MAGSVGVRAKDLHAIIRERELIDRKFQTISMGPGLAGEAAHDLRQQSSGAKAPPPYA